MGILESMRSGSDSTFMQVVVAGVVLAFVFSLARPQADMSQTVAIVNGERIMDTTYHRAYRNELRQLEADQRRTLSDAEQKQLGERVKQQLIEGEVIQQEAERLGLTVSGEEIAMAKLGMGLRTEDGGFDEKAYARFLKQSQFTRDGFEALLREDILRQKLRFLAFMGASLSDPSLKEAWTEQETRVDVQFVRIRPAAFVGDVVIDEASRKQWLLENEALVKETYDRDFDRVYNHPAQVDLSMIRLAVRPDGPGLADLLPVINGLRAQLDTGADFATLAKQYSEDPTALAGGALGKRPVPQLSAETLQAIEGLEVGQLTRAVTSDTDIRIYRVEGREEARVDAFEDVQLAIADELITQERTPALAAAFAEEQLLPQWKENGVLPQSLLDDKGLLATTTGPIPPVASGNPFGPPEAILAASRSMEVGAVFPEVYEQLGTLYVAKLIDRVDPDPAEFDAKKGELKEQVLGMRRSEFYSQWVAETKAEAKIQ